MSQRAIDTLTDFVKGNERSSVIPGFLRPIDTTAIARELNLSFEGKKRGSSELPTSDATSFDSIEETVIQKIESEWAWQGDALIKMLGAYADRLVSYSVPAELANLRLAARDAKAQLANASAHADGELGELKESFLAERKELRRFQETHRITRPARLPGGRWTTIGFLALLMVLEVVVNGLFFAQGNEKGVIGGIGIALGISAVNVILAFLVGFGPARWINRRSVTARVFALLITIACICILLILHGFAVHYRDAMIAVAEQTISEKEAFDYAIAQLISRPWAISNLTSVYLFALGLLFALGAAWKGYKFEDPYPSYGPTYRHFNSARDEYRDAHDFFFEELENVKEPTISALRNGISAIPLYPQRAAQIRAQRATLIDSFRAYETSVETATNQLLQIYRDANRDGRSTQPPTYFGNRWTLRLSFLATSEVKRFIAEEYEPSNSEIKSIIEELKIHCDDVLDEYTKLLSRYPHPTEMSDSHG